MLLIAVAAGVFVPPAVVAAKIVLTVLPMTALPMTGDPAASLARIRAMLLGDARMLLAFMVLMPVVGFLVQKHVLWREGRPPFTIRPPAPPASGGPEAR